MYPEIYEILLPVVLNINLFLIPVFFFIERLEIKKIFKKIKKQTWVLISILFLFGLVLRIFYVPNLHLMYVDEFFYMESAKNILIHGKSELCSYTLNGLDCIAYNKLSGWPLLISWVFLFFGFNRFLIINFNSLLGALSIVMVFLTTYVLFRNEKISLLSSLFTTVLPFHLVWSSTAETNASASLFVLLFVFSFLLYNKTKKWNFFLLSFLTLSFACFIRIENGLLFIPLVAMALLDRKRLVKGKKTLPFIPPLSVFTIFLFTELFKFGWEMGTCDKGVCNSNIEMFGLFFLTENLSGLVASLTHFSSFLITLAFLFLAFYGLKRLYRRNRGASLFLAYSFLSIGIMYLSFKFLQMRFMLVPLILIFILTSAGIFATVERYFSKTMFSKVIYALIALIVLISGINYVNPGNHQGDMELFGRIEKDFSGCYVAADFPSFLTVLKGIKPVNMNYIMREESAKTLVENNCVVFMEIEVPGQEHLNRYEFVDKKYVNVLLGNETFVGKNIRFYRLISLR